MARSLANSRTILCVAAGALVLWVGIGVVRLGLSPDAPADALRSILIAVLLPAIVAALVAWLLAGRRPLETDEARLLASRGALADALESAQEALVTIEEASQQQVQAAASLAQAANALERQGERLESLFSGLREGAPRLIEDARLVGTAWNRVHDQAVRQSDAVRATLVAVREGGARASAEIGVTLARQTQQIEAIEGASKAATAAIASRAYALDAAAEGALARSEVVLSNIAENRAKRIERVARDDVLPNDRAKEVLARARQVVVAAPYLDGASPAKEEAEYVADRFTAAFEALLASLTPNHSEHVIRILLASDIGRLYLRLGARTGRFSERA